MFGKKKKEVAAEAPIEEVKIVEPAVEEEEEEVVEETPKEEIKEEDTEDELTEEKVKGYLQFLYNEIAKIKHHLRIDF